MQSVLSQRLRQRRKEKDMWQYEVAEKAGIAVPDVSRYETGAIEPRLLALGGLSIVLDCSIDWLLGLSETKERR